MQLQSQRAEKRRNLSINFNFRFIALARVMYVHVSIRYKILDSKHFTHTFTHTERKIHTCCHKWIHNAQYV